MKKIIAFLFVLCCLTDELHSQVPYFADTPGDNTLYGYVSMKFRPGINAQETYTTFQYGLGNQLAIGTDISTSVDNSYIGFLFRAGKALNKWFKFGGQVTPSFNLQKNLELHHITAALYLNGAITKSSRLFWVSNTWFTYYLDGAYDIDQWAYLGYTCPLGSQSSISPLAGTIYSWKLNSAPKLAAGAYLTAKETYNFYLWFDSLFEKSPRIVIGMDFKF